MAYQRKHLGLLVLVTGACVVGLVAPADPEAEAQQPAHPVPNVPQTLTDAARQAILRSANAANEAWAHGLGAPSYFISEAGLFSNFAARTISPDFVEYEPNYHLWSDGDQKRRFISVPPGTKIDTSDPDHWKFPAGTRIFKQFKSPDNSKYLEHRVIVVQPNGTDVFVGTYVWNDAQTEATLNTTGVTGLFGTTWDVPSQTECHSCHQGEPGYVLGVSAVQTQQSLLTTLASQSHFNAVPAAFTVPGNSVERAALGYLHANCGHCHNAGTGMMHSLSQNLRLNIADTNVWNTTTYKTTVGQAMQAFAAPGIQKRVVAGHPEESAIAYRMHYRRPADTHGYQMPEIGTSLVDNAGIATVEDWIRHITTYQIVPPIIYPVFTFVPPHEGCKPIVNEVHMQSRVRGTADEYVELYNPCTTKFTFTADWRLTVAEVLGSANEVVLKNLAGLTIEPKGFLLIAGTGYSDTTAKAAATFNPPTNVVLPGIKPSGNHTTWNGRVIPAQAVANARFGHGLLSSTAATVALFHRTTLVDSVSWGTPDVKGTHQHVLGTPLLPPPAGLSLGRRPNAPNTKNNMKDFITQPPTPGRANH